MRCPLEFEAVDLYFYFKKQHWELNMGGGVGGGVDLAKWWVGHKILNEIAEFTAFSHLNITYYF